MPVVTIRNLPDDLIQRIRESASRHGISMEQEIRNVLKNTYENKAEIIDQIINNWDDSLAATPEEVNEWKNNRRAYNDH